jgi:hypothetical protein
MDIKDLLPLIGVVIGGIIAILGNLVTVLIQRNQERIRFQKEIYESKFSEAESKIKAYCLELEKLRQTPIIESTLEASEKILPVERVVINSLVITGDFEILKSIENFYLRDYKLGSLSWKIKDDEYFDFEEAAEAILLLEDACANLLISIDKFKLRGYRPKKQFSIIRFWQWITKRKV